MGLALRDAPGDLLTRVHGYDFLTVAAVGGGDAHGGVNEAHLLGGDVEVVEIDGVVADEGLQLVCRAVLGEDFCQLGQGKRGGEAARRAAAAVVLAGGGGGAFRKGGSVGRVVRCETCRSGDACARDIFPSPAVGRSPSG